MKRAVMRILVAGATGALGRQLVPRLAGDGYDVAGMTRSEVAPSCFRVPELTDGDGVKAITGEVRQIEGVSGVEIDLHTRWVVITSERIDTDAIRRAVRQARLLHRATTLTNYIASN